MARVRRAAQTRATEEESIPALPAPLPKPARRKKPKSQTAAPVETEETPAGSSSVLPQALMIGGLAACAFVILALASYDVRDASLSNAGSRLVHNRAGPVGAYLSDAFYQGFGYAAWSVLLVAGLLGLRLAGRRLGGIWNWLLVSAAVFLGMIGLELAMGGAGRAFPPGGLVGLLVANALKASVGPYGAAMLVVGAMAVVATALFRIDWQPVADKVVTGLQDGAPRVARRIGQAGVGAVRASVQAGAQGAQVLRQKLEERRQEPEESWEEEEEEEDEPAAEPLSKVEPLSLPSLPAPRSGVWSARAAPPPPLAAEVEHEVTAVAERALVEVEWEPTATADARRDGIPRPLPPNLSMPLPVPKTGNWAIPLRPDAPVPRRDEIRPQDALFVSSPPAPRPAADPELDARPPGTRRDPRTLAGFGPDEEYPRRAPKEATVHPLRPVDSPRQERPSETGIRREEARKEEAPRGNLAEPSLRSDGTEAGLRRAESRPEVRPRENTEAGVRREGTEAGVREGTESLRRMEPPVEAMRRENPRPEGRESSRLETPRAEVREVAVRPTGREAARMEVPRSEGREMSRAEVPRSEGREMSRAETPRPETREMSWMEAPRPEPLRMEPEPPRPLSPTAEIADPPRRGRGALVVPGNLQSGGNDDDGQALRRAEHFLLPPLSLLDEHPIVIGGHDDLALQDMARKLTAKLKTYGVEGRVVAIRPGPVITLFEYEPAAGVKLSKISSLSDDLKMALEAVSVRIVAPIPGRGVVGVEIPNRSRQIVWSRDVFASKEFRESGHLLPMILGKDTEGRPFVTDLAKMPHLLVGGTTGSGKSVGINTMLCSLLYTRPPSELRMILIDPKMLEFELYQDIPHLLHPVVTEAKLASAVLKWACVEMDDRYRMLARWQTRNIEGYNQRVDQETQDWTPSKATRFGLEEGQLPRKLPYIVIVIDELADLMMVAAKDVEESIVRLAQKARAAGIHLIVATQRPSVDVITGLIKANMPSRLAYQVRSKTDGRTILDQNGAETLLGKGDLLFLPPGSSGLIRAHGPFLADEEVRRVAEFLKAQGAPEYAPAVAVVDEDGELQEDLSSEMDENYDHAVSIAIELGRISTSMIQRRLKIGYNRAARIMEIMEREGVVGPADGAKPREVLVGKN